VVPADSAKRVALPGDHHYNDDYPTVARAIIEQLHGLSKP
ncbi:AcvB/VirJ family lysyl-phosphatidylglycerol hydrolase, partial [Xanthomonas fragariae]